MHSQDSLSRRLGPEFAEIAAQMEAQMEAQAANAQQGPKSGQQAVENPNPMPAPPKAYKPAHGGYPAWPTMEPTSSSSRRPAGTKLPTTIKAPAHCAQHEPCL